MDEPVCGFSRYSRIIYSDSEDEDALSDDNDYDEYMKKLNKQKKNLKIETEADRKKRQLEAVFAAIINEKIDVAFLEIDNGLDVNIDLESGWTPLLLASTLANTDLLLGLVKRGADVNKKRDDGTTPLMLLCNINANDEKTEKRILSCVQCLLENNADQNATDNKRRTAVMFAAQNGHLETVKFLIPLVEKDAEDNQRWNVLFWAVDGNHLNVVEFLLSTGDLNIEKTDVRGNTVVDLANINGFHDIVDLFPKDPFDEFYLYLSNNKPDFEETFNNLEKEKPQFFSDICKILYGTRSESVMPILVENNIGLLEFLALSEARLKELGVEFAYQRNRIMGGIYKFHKHPFKPQSIPFVKKEQIYTNIDVSSTVLTSIKQLIAMEASLKFILDNSEKKLSLAESKEVQILVSRCRGNILRLKGVSEQLSKKSQQWDLLLGPADRITKKRRNVPWSNLWLSISLISISLIIFYKLN